MKKLIIIVLVLCLVFSLLSGCGSKKEEELPILRVAVLPFYFCTPAYYVSEQGLDVANGFKIQFETYPMGGPLLEALPANEWDISFIGTAGVYGVANQGIMPISQIMYAAAGSGAFIRPDSDEAAVKDEIAPGVYGNAETLRGSKVLVPLGSLDHFTVALWMKAAGLTTDDYEVVHMDTNATSYQAFQVGEGDITSLSPPIYTDANKAGYIMAADMKLLGLEYIDCIYANPSTYDKQKDIIAKFIKLEAEAQDMFFNDKDMAAEWGLKYLKDANGIDTTKEVVMIEVMQRPFVTIAELKALKDDTLAKPLRGVCEFFEGIGKLEVGSTKNFDDRTITNTDILDMAFAN